MKIKSQSNQLQRHIQLTSDTNLFELFTHKKYQECLIKIPETILLEKGGYIKQWLFNSSKANHAILKKKKQNCTPLNFIKNICGSTINEAQISHCKTIQDVKEEVQELLKQQKDYQFIKDKKAIEIVTTENQIFQMSLRDFLTTILQNKYVEQSFYDKWKIIQNKVTHSKIDQYYIIQSSRKNHLIQSKCEKIISINTGLATSISTEIDHDKFKEVSPSKAIVVAEHKNIEGYKFFDSYLNKKFFNLAQELIEFIETNYKCIVEGIQTKFVINKEREPHLVGITGLKIKIVKRICELRQYKLNLQHSQMSFENYMKCLQIYLFQRLQSQEVNLEQPLKEQRKFRCKGEFCDARACSIPHLIDQRVKLPSINNNNSNNSRKINSEIIVAVKKRRTRVIEKMKEHKMIDKQFTYEDNQSSEYEEMEEEQQIKTVRVCQNCFLFYINAIKLFDIDGYKNLIERKMTPRKIQDSQKPSDIKTNQEVRTNQPFNKTQNQDKPQIDIFQKQKHSFSRYNSAGKILPQKYVNDPKEINLVQKSFLIKALDAKEEKVIQKSSSLNKPFLGEIQKKNLKPLASPKKEEDQKISKKHSIERKQQKAKTLLSLTKITQPAKIHEKLNSQSKTIMPKAIPSKALNFEEASQQILKKIENLPNSSKEQLIYFCKKYYENNLPQYVDRRCYSSSYMTNLYEFMNNSPLNLEKQYKIKRRPEMSLKRLSELTNYPEIVSRSTFKFDTLICDEKTTIPFCVISTKMIHNKNISGEPFENIFLINDIFDSYIEYIAFAKDLLEDTVNKRFILFNYPGQSHTIYDSNSHFRTCDFNSILDKLIYRLSCEKDQLGIMNLDNQKVKLIGMGYGCYLLTSFLAANQIYKDVVSGVLLVNAFQSMTSQYKNMIESLFELYQSNDPTAESEAFLYYSKAIQSTEHSNEDLESKAGLNSIRIQGRSYILKNILLYYHKDNLNDFEEYKHCQVVVLYGRNNVLLHKAEARSFLTYQMNPNLQITNRELFEVEGGHDLIADNYQDLFKYAQKFIH